MIGKSIILVCPLNWGIGHASRLIPVINDLNKTGYKVIIAGDGKALQLLKDSFPTFDFIQFDGYNISYSKSIPMSLKILFQVPKILKGIKKEHTILEEIIEKYKIDIVISDNRFGLYTDKAKCIYITHQVMIKMPFLLKYLEFLLYRYHKKYIKRYNECWIPDIKTKPNIAGDLSSKFIIPENAKFIGPLSRFSQNIAKNGIYNTDILVILSGPEPQRTLFENKLIEQISKTKYKTIMVRGLVDNELNLPENIKLLPHMSSKDLESQIANSKYIICRSGYSSIMDLLRLKRNAILVPTPGQTEQEYLAKYYHKLGIFFSMSQKKFNLEIALKEVEDFNKSFELSEKNIITNYAELL